jgi:hypothetical protein
MSDLEAVKQMLDRAEQVYTQHAVVGGHVPEIDAERWVAWNNALDGASTLLKVDSGPAGYSGFFTTFSFDSSGALLSVNAWE